MQNAVVVVAVSSYAGLAVCIPAWLCTRKYENRALREISRNEKPQILALVAWGRAVRTLIIIAIVSTVLANSMAAIA